VQWPITQRKDEVMFIQIESTPNPATLKFLPGRTVIASGTANFPDAASAVRSPLAQKLFALDGVVGVFFGHDFVTVTKAAESDWYVLKPDVLGVIMTVFTNDEKIMLDGAGTTGESTAEAEDDEIVSQIKELIDTRVRPAVAQDGGDIIFHGFEDGVVYLHMQGSCSGCPSSTATLKSGIENMLRHYIPEVYEVRAI
jgi:Fe-S cluster biogenesis protein NfuA